MGKNQITIFCDGASKGNPGPGGWAAVLVWDEKVKELGGKVAHTTNNQMELMAGIKALEGIKKEKGEINIYTDSRYLINGITKWVNSWQKNGWKTKAKKDVLNKDLWKKLIVLVKGKKISWNYVGGHIGIVGNERCDEIASGLATGEKIKLYDGPLSEYGLDILSIDHNSLKKEAKQTKSKANSKIKAYSYLSLVNGVLNIDKTWPECEARVKGKSGAKFQKAISPIHEQEILKNWGVK